VSYARSAANLAASCPRSRWSDSSRRDTFTRPDPQMVLCDVFGLESFRPGRPKLALLASVGTGMT
jgi:hypothetical protein